MRFVLVTTVAALCLAACSDGSAPAGNSRVYVLRSIDGIALPAPYVENTQLDNRMFADTLVLRNDGTGEWRIVIEETVGGAKQHVVEALTWTGTTHVEIAFTCPPGADCIAPPHLAGDVTSGGILFTMSKVTRAPLVFERVVP